jgi:hypothetical protein
MADKGNRFFAESLLLCLSAYDQTWPLGNRPLTTSIHILDDDSLLNVFHLYRPAILDGDEDDDVRAFGGRLWDRERWRYKLARVCQRW